MSCYLKVSYLNRHRKYIYRKDKPINFQQIHKELQVNLPPSAVFLQISHTPLKKEGQLSEVKETNLSEQQLCTYLNSLNLGEKQTVRIKIYQRNSNNDKECKDSSEQLGGLNQRSGSLRMMRKAEEMKVETVTLQLKTDSIDLTQQFLCNSTNDRFSIYQTSFKEDIMKELQANKLRKKQVEKNKKLKNISEIYMRIKEVIE